MFKPWAILIILAALAIALFAADRNPLIGTWTLNFAESRLASGAPQYNRVTCKIEPWEADGLKVVYDMVGTRGGVTHWEWVGKLDGKDYQLEGVDEAVTNAYSQTGDRTYNIVLKVDGRITSTSRVEVSADGRTMIVTTGSAKTIYKKH